MLRVGVLGAGMIATNSMGVLPGVPHLRESIEITAIASRTRAKAEAAAQRFGIAQVREVDDLLHADDIDAVVNLTPINAHFELNREVLRNGKHLATEKPLAGTLEEAGELIRLATENDLRIVASPPRLTEPSRLRARQHLLDGTIGKVTFARARSSHAGPAALNWPTDPSAAYASGASPFRDLAPYAIQQLTGLLGPARSVTALSGRTEAEKTVQNGPFAGKVFPVDTDDNTVLLLDFGDAVFGVVDAGFSVRATTSPAVEIFGTHGTINLHTDYPTRESGSLEVFTAESGWSIDSPPQDRTEEQRRWKLGRAVLLEELARSVRSRADSLLSAEQARHTLAVIIAAEESAATGARVPVKR